MSSFKLDEGIKFNFLGSWTVRLLSIPLLLPLILVPSSPLSSPTASISSGTASKQLAEPTPSLTPQRQAKQVPTTHPATAKAPKPAAKAQKQASVKKNNKSKSKAQPQYNAPEIEIKVAIAEDAPNLAIGTSTSARILDANRKVLRKLPANRGLTARANGEEIYLGDWQLPSVVWIQPTQGGYVYVGDRWYRGQVLLYSQGSTLLAVNHVNLEQYLYSVVGSEMHPTAPMAALKAQAIAARSYAMVHLYRPATAWYNLGNTERWQVYKGLQGEWNTSHQAVKGTAGEILSHQGGIVESLYAASDEIVLEAHGGNGMSQTGAYKLAAQGYDYRQILGTYYPNTQLARLELKN